MEIVDKQTLTSSKSDGTMHDRYKYQYNFMFVFVYNYTLYGVDNRYGCH